MSTESLLRRLERAVRDLLRGSGSAPTKRPASPKRPAPPASGRPIPGPRQGGRNPSGSSANAEQAPVAYPGDFTGRTQLSYSPHPDRYADPGEIVWTWVPFEEDHTQGKDRPVLVIGRDGDWLLALPLTSQDHDLDAAQEATEGRFWIDIGSGSWDNSGRASEARVNRILRIAPKDVRRIAGKLDPGRFQQVAQAVAEHW